MVGHSEQHCPSTAADLRRRRLQDQVLHRHDLSRVSGTYENLNHFFGVNICKWY